MKSSHPSFFMFLIAPFGAANGCSEWQSSAHRVALVTGTVSGLYSVTTGLCYAGFSALTLAAMVRTLALRLPADYRKVTNKGW